MSLNTNAATDSGDDSTPSIAADEHDHWVVVWQSDDSLGGTIGMDTDILFSRSVDGGVTWSAPAPLNTNAATDSGDDVGARIATDGQGLWVVVWSTRDALQGTIGTDGDILVSRSTDNGATWTNPVALNTNALTDQENDYRPRVVSDGLGTWLATWRLSRRIDNFGNYQYLVAVAKSTSGGVTWSDPILLNTERLNRTSDIAPTAASGGNGSWGIVWHSPDVASSLLGRDGDIVLVRSLDNGATWTSPVALNIDAAGDDRTDKLPRMAANSQGNWIVVWQAQDANGGLGTDGDILVSTSSDNAVTWTAPAPLDSMAADDVGDDGRPEIATDRHGNWVTAWVKYGGVAAWIVDDTEIHTARSSDNGATWNGPISLNTDAGVDHRNDYIPAISTDAQGNWMAAWDGDPIAAEPTGNDRDVFFARFELPDDCNQHQHCDDEQFCNGIEACHAGSTLCLPSVSPCTLTEICDEDQDRCFPIPLIHANAVRSFVEPGDSVRVEVFVDGPIASLQGYQAKVQVVRSFGSGTMSVPCPGGAQVNESRPDYIFREVTSFHPTNCHNLRLAAAIFPWSNFEVPNGPQYLGEFTFVVSADAAIGSRFEVSVEPPPLNTIFRARYGGTVPLVMGTASIVTVAECTPYGDIYPLGGDAKVDVDDLSSMLAAYGGDPGVDADIWPCTAGNGAVDQDDVLAMLDAFVGTPPCPDWCQF